jgi:hypothetical protein
MERLRACVSSCIGRYAFLDCDLPSVTIPGSVTSIGEEAFAYCSGLRAVYFKGNLPLLGSSVFEGDSDATVYFLPGTTGWGSALSGLPVVLWNPQAQTGGLSFGVRTNLFGFAITGASASIGH